MLGIAVLRTSVGDEDREDGSSGGGGAAAETNVAAVFFHDGFADPQSQAGTAITLQGKEGSEELCSLFDRNSCAVVEDGNADARDLTIVPATRSRDMNDDVPALVDRIEGVHEEVGEHLPKFRAIGG